MNGHDAWFRLTFPREVTTTQALAGLLALNGLSTPRRRDVIVLEARGQHGEVVHHLRVPGERAGSAVRQLQAHLPGLAVEETSTPPLVIDRAWRAWQSTAQRSMTADQPEAIALGLLSALSAAERDEVLVLQWLLGPVRRPQAVGSRHPSVHGPGLVMAVIKSALVAPADLDSEARRALRLKQAMPGWQAVLQLGVRAHGTPRQRQLLGHLASGVRVAQGPGVQLGFDGVNPVVVQNRQRPWRWGLVINGGELVGLTAWPLGDTAHLPVARVRSRALPVPRALGRDGHVVGTATYPGQERPVAVSVADSLMHIHLIGATGAGKSTVLLNLITQDMQAGRAVALIEPKGDLTEDVLARVPTHRLDDVVVLDPTDERPVGLNPLVQPGVPHEVITDQVLAVFKGLFGEAIGPRTQDLLSAGLMTLLSGRDPTLVALPLLYTDEGFRRGLVSRLSDRLVLGPFWAWYEGLTSGERAAVLAPLMNKLRHLLVRPRTRRTLGQRAPRFDIRELYTRRRIVLLNLNKGALGGESAGLIGSLALSMLWQATLSRAAIPASRRHPTFVYVDEFQDYLHLPQDFADVLTQARGLGTGLVLAHQHLAQLSPTVKAAVLANARSRLVFTVSLDDAAVLIRGDNRLHPEDVASLARYQAYASLLAGSEPQPFTSVRTMPPPPIVSNPDEVRARSRERYGVPAGAIDAALEGLVGTNSSKTTHSTDFGIRRRGVERADEGEES